jgi:P2-related tail formation protein
MSNILATGIGDKDFIKAFDKMIESRMNAIDLTPLLIYLVDIAPSEALYHLADQFNVLGFKGWFLCSNDDERRSLIKRAIELHRYKGTPWAIKEALKSIGFYDAKIQEHAGGIFYDGVNDYNGMSVYGGGGWATFRIQLLDLGETKGISTESLATIIQMINEYKNARSTLIGILFYATVSDIIEPNDDDLIGEIQTDEVDELFGLSILYNGSYKYDGTQLYSQSIEEFDITLEYQELTDNNSTPQDLYFEIKLINLAEEVILHEIEDNS